MARRTLVLFVLGASLLGSIACSAQGPTNGKTGAGGTGSGSASTGTGSGGAGGELVLTSGSGSGGSGGGAKPPAMVVDTLPPGFTSETNNGGWKVVGLLADFTEPS